jgi:excisionase family DNA binding protein
MSTRVIEQEPIGDESESVAHAPLALRAKDAARALGIGERQLWSLTKAGKIPCVRIGRSVVYHVASLDEWLRRRAKGGK